MQAEEIKYQKGAYGSFEEIVNKTPSKQIDLQVIRRSKGDIKMVGGNDYKQETNNKIQECIVVKINVKNTEIQV